MKEALVALDQVNWNEETQIICEELALSEDDIGEAVAKLTEAHLYFVNNPDVDAPVDALNKVGWYDTHPGARYLIYGRLGEVLLGGFFMALRDVSEHADESAQAREIAELVAVGKQVMERGSGKICKDETEFSKLERRTEELTARHRSQTDALKLARQRMVAAEQDQHDKARTINELKQRQQRAERDIQILGEQAETLEAQCNNLGSITNKIRNFTLWQAIWWAFASPEKRDKWFTQHSTSETSTDSSEK